VVQKEVGKGLIALSTFNTHLVKFEPRLTVTKEASNMTDQSLDVLFSLPSELAVCILSEWVGLKELSGLDIAYCNHGKRDTLLTIFSLEGFVLREEVPVSQTNYIAWINKRKIRQEVFYVNGNMLEFVEYAEKFGKHVKRATFVNVANKMAEAVLACGVLASLCIVGGTESKQTLEAISNRSSLRELRVDFRDYNCTEYSLSTKHVAPLQLSTLVVATDSAHTRQIVRMASPTKLISLQVTLSKYFKADNLRKYLSKGCNLKALCLEGTPSNKGVISLVKLCPDLRHLDIDCCIMTQECVSELAFQLSQLRLEVLRLSGCSFANELLLGLAAQGCNTLQVLFQDNGHSTDGNGINSIAKGLTKLKIRLLISEQFAAMDLRLFSNLTHLMVGLHISLLAKDFLNGVATHCTNLTHLALSMNTGSPYDFIPILGNNLLPALSYLHVYYVEEEWDTSVLQTIRPNLYICRAYGPSWHSFEDIVCKTGRDVW